MNEHLKSLWGNNTLGLEVCPHFPNIATAKSLQGSEFYTTLLATNQPFNGSMSVIKYLVKGIDDNDKKLFGENGEVITIDQVVMFAAHMVEVESLPFADTSMPTDSTHFVGYLSDTTVVHLIKRNGVVELHTSPFHTRGRYLAGVAHIGN